MGMYDYLNDEQIKFFFVPFIGMPDEFIDSSTLSYSGGRLFYFGKNKNVPYKTFWYNYGKDFNIIDFYPYEHEEPIVHMIRNGKNTGYVELHNFTDKLFDCVNYDDRGDKLKINNISDFNDCLNARNAFKEALANLPNEAHSRMFQWSREHAMEKDKSEETIKERDILMKAMIEETKNHEIILKPFREKIGSYYDNCNFENLIAYEHFGAITYSLHRLAKNLLSMEKISFVVRDERLIFATAYDEMKTLLNSSENFLNQYFLCLNVDKRSRRVFRNMLKFIEESYDKIINMRIEKENLNDRYVLKDIEEGRYKKYYLKYCIEPYIGFKYN